VRGCAGWQLNSWNVRSGAVTSFETSILEARVTLVRPGRVSFAYYVSAEEGFDGLVFLIDKATVTVNASTADLPLVSNTPQLANFSAALTAGTHVLTWRFFKDFITNRGSDMAYIKNLLILGTSYADEMCASCPSGTFAAGQQWSECKLCDANTKAPNPGTVQCTPCDADHEFSFPGATSCLQRQLCTAEDYQVQYGDCTVDPEHPDGRSRQRTYAWVEPKLCDSISGMQLPPADTTTCRVCPAGMRRATGDPVCRPCATGSAGGGGTATCNVCAAGEAAQRSFLLDGNFNGFPDGMTTRCDDFDCGSRGWRVLPEGIGSGIGHGRVAQSVLTWDIDVVSLNPQPYVEFVSTLECPGKATGDTCEFSFAVVGNFSASYTSATRRVVRVDLTTVGRRKLVWTFTKAYAESTALTDAARRARVTIQTITLVGASIGGAPMCVKCANGTVAVGGSDRCTTCLKGTGPTADRTTCAACANDEYAPSDGAGCRKCPSGTNRINATACDDGGCKFKDGSRQYDLTPLKSYKFYGPVMVNEHVYEINVCSLDHHISSDCVDTQNRSINAYACQILESGIGLSLGNEIGFYALNRTRNITGNGLTVKYTGGEIGCRRSESLSYPINGVPRSAEINFLCDPDAGKGYPEPCVDGNLTSGFFSFFSNGVEPSPCQYCFEWRSVYACPVCDESDRQQVYSECRVGMRRAFWKWRDDRQCHGGQLPPPTSVPCSQGALTCPAGQRLPPGETRCLSCPNGTYSLGNGTEYFSFEQTLDLFVSPPASSGKSTWTFDGPLLASGDGTSEISLTVFFVTNGTLEFNYLLMGDSGVLTLLLENRAVLTTSGGATPGRFRRDGLKGDVTFVWRFERGRSSLVELADVEKAIVYGLRVTGTDLASPDCDVCPRGSAASRENSTACAVCERNTFASRLGDGVDSGATACAPCAANEYSYMSSISCIKRDPTCETEGVHYDVVYTPCVNGQRTKYYRLLDEPRLCVDAEPVERLANVTAETCDVLPVCGAGKYATTNLTCQPVPVGFVPVFTRKYLTTLDDKSVEPADLNALPTGKLNTAPLINTNGVSTWCTNLDHVKAVCYGGWRARGGYAVDSGSHGDGWVDSLLAIKASNETFIVADLDGELQFDATFVDNGAVAGQLPTTAARAVLFVYYGQRLMATVFKKGTYKITLPADALPLAEQVITFRYHQDRLEDTDKSDRRQRAVRVWDITLRSSIGQATEVRKCGDGFTSNGVLCHPCPAGKSSRAGGPCIACSNNTVAIAPGSLCVPCGRGTTAAAIPTKCETSCVFPIANVTFDLTTLASLNNGSDLRILAARDTTFYLSPCAAAAECISDKLLGPRGHVVERRADGACSVVGAQLNFSLAESTSPMTNQTIVTGINLDYKAAVAPTADCPSGQRATRIAFVCSPSFGVGEPRFIDALGDSCTNTFLWQSALGCRMCTQDDYIKSATPCTNGRRQASLLRRAVCNGPAVIEEKALAANFPKFAGQELGDYYCVEYEFPAWVLYTFGGIVLAIALCAVGLCIYNRRIKTQYKALEEATANQTQMTLIDDDSEEETAGSTSAAAPAKIPAPKTKSAAAAAPAVDAPAKPKASSNGAAAATATTKSSKK
jgi:hypothetical protein